MRREELRKLIVGPIATVPTPFDDDFEVDFGRMRELTQRWVESGLVKGKAVIKVAAAMGEGPMLRDDEWPYLLRTVVQAADDKAAILCGLHYKDTKRTIEDAKRAQDMGAIGLQVCPPIFNLPTQDDLLEYFEDLSNAIDIGIMIYHTHWMLGGRIETDTFCKMADFEQVAAIKWDNPEGVPYDDMTKFCQTFNVIDNSGQPARCHELGGNGYINLALEAYPAHYMRVWELAENGQYEECQALHESADIPLRKLYAKFEQASGGQARLKKGIMALMGQPVGASRPPSKPLSPEETEELRQVMVNLGWPVVGA